MKFKDYTWDKEFDIKGYFQNVQIISIVRII